MTLMSAPITTPNAALPRRSGARAHRTIVALMLREMATTFGRSPGGYIWALLEPIAAIALLSFAFSLAFRAPPLGSSFALFYATGYLPYMVFHDIAQKTAAATRFSRPLFTFGAVGWAEAVLARIVLNTLTHLMIFVIVIAGLVATLPGPATIDVPVVLAALAMAALLAAGIGTLNCYLFMAFPAWERLWMIAMRPLFIVSGVLFLLEDVPSAYQSHLWANPLFHVTGMMRSAFYPDYSPDYLSPAFGFGSGLLFLFFGASLLRRYHDDLVAK